MTEQQLMEKMKNRMTEGKPYVASYLPADKNKKYLWKFNKTPQTKPAKRMKFISKALGSIGKNGYIEAPLYFDHGWNIHIGENFYANTGLIVLDQCPVTIGDRVFMGPRIGIYCATHPVDARVRSLQLEGGKPVTIGNDVWIGGDVTICPGVRIGSNVVIGAGSVVVKDIPDNCIAVGNPCKKMRDITDADKNKWEEELRAFEEDTGIKLV